MPLGFIVSSMISVPAKLMVVLAACAIDRLRRAPMASRSAATMARGCGLPSRSIAVTGKP
jgi:hypothetical protein